MLLFGFINTCADYATFGILYLFFHADIPIFRSGWFLENIMTASLAVLLFRTKKPFFCSRPSTLLLVAVFGTIGATLLLPLSLLLS